MATRFFPNYDEIRITSPFGMRKLFGEEKMHSGIDLVAKDGKGRSALDFVTAHTGGEVASVGYNDSCGNYITLQCGDARMVYYHLKEKPKFKKGDAVAQGQILGYMGATGKVTGAHLHFGIRVNGKWIDPQPYLHKNYGEVEQTYENIPLRTITSGAKGEDVKAAQILLTGRDCRGNMHAPDGIFGPNTLGATRLFQEKCGLTPDGIIGPLTWKALLGVQ